MSEELVIQTGDIASSSAMPAVGGGDLLSMGISMVIVVAVILLLGWLYSRSRFVSGGANGVISIIASRALGPKERLLVVEVADQQLLVGMTATAVQTLHVFDTPVSVPDKNPGNSGFAGRMKTALQEIGK